MTTHTTIMTMNTGQAKVFLLFHWSLRAHLGSLSSTLLPSLCRILLSSSLSFHALTRGGQSLLAFHRDHNLTRGRSRGGMSYKHKTLESAVLSDSSVAVSHIQRLIPKGKGLRETTIR